MNTNTTPLSQDAKPLPKVNTHIFIYFKNGEIAGVHKIPEQHRGTRDYAYALKVFASAQRTIANVENWEFMQEEE